MIKEMAHLCFSVRDLEASIAFYTQKLGLTRAFDFVRDDGERYGIYLKVGRRSFIELFKSSDVVNAEKTSYRHFCLEVDDLQKTVADLRGKGVEVTDPKLGKDQSWQAWLADPDGNKIELHQYTRESWQAPHAQ